MWCVCAHLYDVCMPFVLYAPVCMCVCVHVCGMCANMWHICGGVHLDGICMPMWYVHVCICVFCVHMYGCAFCGTCVCVHMCYVDCVMCVCKSVCEREKGTERQTSSLWEPVCMRNIRVLSKEGWGRGPPSGKEGGGGQRPRMFLWEGPGLLLRDSLQLQQKIQKALETWAWGP